MLIEQTIEFEWKGPGHPGLHVLLEFVVFMTKKISKENLRVDYY